VSHSKNILCTASIIWTKQSNCRV